jgi:hypothetical protein
MSELIKSREGKSELRALKREVLIGRAPLEDMWRG